VPAGIAHGFGVTATLFVNRGVCRGIAYRFLGGANVSRPTLGTFRRDQAGKRAIKKSKGPHRGPGFAHVKSVGDVLKRTERIRKTRASRQMATRVAPRRVA